MATPLPVQMVADRVKLYIEDPAYDFSVGSGSSFVEGLMLEALEEIASRVKLPGLKTVATVETVAGQEFVQIPRGYMEDRMRSVYSVTYSRPVALYPSLDFMLKDLGQGILGRAGSVMGVAPEGDTLWLGRTPANPETLRVVYDRRPTLADCGHSGNALIHPVARYVAYNLWDGSEDGMEVAKRNTQRHEVKFEELVEKLRIHYGPGDPRVPVEAHASVDWDAELGV
ncbi:hypothetical protein [Oceanidesulfovibrio marinus]|uniref:Uncharacterized protein n=1 Tax=Oceanidesulfovibrio marinus TaxID=370038 RepID=A0A6P1ZCT7_9BACT|nr:hypothetical protein [Oceanidesulfovibrio marinus]TVM31162.1 hypothetical protein DQK91_18810 [Oceanidesulfovibrio marinus]